MKRKAQALLLLIVLGSICSCTAQVVTMPPGNREKNADSRAALRVVTEVLDGASQIQSPLNRIKIKSEAAALLLKTEPENVAKAYGNIAADFDGLAASIELDQEGLREQALALRTDVVRLLSEHNAVLALEFLRSTNSFNSRQPSPSADSEAQLNLVVAAKLVSVDPKRAYDLARNNLSRKVTALVPELVVSLRGEDEKLARDLTDALFERLVGSDLARDEDAFFGAITLLQIDLQSSEEKPSDSNPAKLPLLAAQRRNELIKRLLSAAMGGHGKSHGLPQQLAAANLQITGQGGSAAAFNSFVIATSNLQNETEELIRSYQVKIETRPVNEVLGELPEAPVVIRDSLYAQAAWKIAATGDITTAAQALSNVADRDERRNLLDRLFSEEISRAARRGDRDQVREMLGRLSSNEVRLRAMIQASIDFGLRDGSEAARRTLEEALSQLGPRARNAGELELHLQISNGFAQLGLLDKASDSLTPTVQVLSDVVEAGRNIGGFIDGSDSYEDGELSLISNGPIRNLYFECAEALEVLGRIDLPRALAAANLLAQPETRLMARLYAARGALRNADQTGIRNSTRPSQPSTSDEPKWDLDRP